MSFLHGFLIVYFLVVSFLLSLLLCRAWTKLHKWHSPFSVLKFFYCSSLCVLWHQMPTYFLLKNSNAGKRLRKNDFFFISVIHDFTCEVFQTIGRKQKMRERTNWGAKIDLSGFCQRFIHCSNSICFCRCQVLANFWWMHFNCFAATQILVYTLNMRINVVDWIRMDLFGGMKITRMSQSGRKNPSFPRLSQKFFCLRRWKLEFFISIAFTRAQHSELSISIGISCWYFML